MANGIPMLERKIEHKDDLLTLVAKPAQMPHLLLFIEILAVACRSFFQNPRRKRKNAISRRPNFGAAQQVRRDDTMQDHRVYG
jgi:hypothetical protein